MGIRYYSYGLIFEIKRNFRLSRFVMNDIIMLMASRPLLASESLKRNVCLFRLSKYQQV